MVESPELVRKQLRPAIPKPDTPRPLAKAGSKGGSATALIEEKQTGVGGGGDFSDAAAAAVLASSSGEKKGEDVGGESGEAGLDENETGEGKDGEAGEGRRIQPR